MLSFLNTLKKSKNASFPRHFADDSHIETGGTWKPSTLLRTQSWSVGSNLHLTESLSLNTSSSMETYLAPPRKGSNEEASAQNFIDNLHAHENQKFADSLAHLLALKHNIDPALLNSLLASRNAPVQDDEKCPNSPEISSAKLAKLNTSKNIGFLFVELLHEDIPLTFANNKSLVCLVSLSQETLTDELRFQAGEKFIGQNLEESAKKLEAAFAELKLEKSRMPKEDRDPEKIRRLTQRCTTVSERQATLEKKARKLSASHEKYHQMKPHIHIMNESIRMISDRLNADAECPIYFIPTLKFRNRFVEDLLTRLDLERVPHYENDPVSAGENFREYVELKTMEEDEKEKTIRQFEQLMSSPTPVLSKSCSEKMLSNTMLKLIRFSIRNNESPVSLHFKSEVHYPLTYTMIRNKIMPTPHENCKNCKFTWFLIHQALQNKSTFPALTGLNDLLECLSDDDDPIHTINAIAIAPYNLGCAKQTAMLINIRDLINSYTSPGVDNSQNPCIVLLRDLSRRVSRLQRQHLDLFGQLTLQLSEYIAKLTPHDTEIHIREVFEMCCMAMNDYAYCAEEIRTDPPARPVSTIHCRSGSSVLFPSGRRTSTSPPGLRDSADRKNASSHPSALTVQLQSQIRSFQK